LKHTFFGYWSDVSKTASCEVQFPAEPEPDFTSNTAIIFKRDTVIETKVLKNSTTFTTIQDKVDDGLQKLSLLQLELNKLITDFTTINF